MSRTSTVRGVKVVDGLFIGTYESTKNADFLKEAGISTIINVSGIDDANHIDQSAIDYYYFAINDQEYMPEEFDRAFNRVAYIVEEVKCHMPDETCRGAVLIVSRECINRALLIAGMYLVGEKGFDVSKTVTVLTSANQARDPDAKTLLNRSFRKMIELCADRRAAKGATRR